MQHFTNDSIQISFQLPSVQLPYGLDSDPRTRAPEPHPPPWEMENWWIRGSHTSLTLP